MSASFAGSGQEIRIDITGQDLLTPTLRSASDSIALFTANAERSLSTLARFGAQAAPVLALATAFGSMAKQASSVQQNVANLNAVLQTTPSQLAAIRNQGLQLSQVTQFTDSQILLAQRQLAKGHQGPGAIMAETPSVLNLAGATQSQPQQAATSFISAQRQFKLGVADTTDTVNTLAQATDASLGTLAAFSSGMKNVGPVANAVGIDLRTTATALADLSQAGLQGAQGGTSLRMFLQHIQRETPAARKEIDALGLSFYDQAGRMRALPDIMDQIRQKMAALSQEQRDTALTTIFGTRGALAADIFAQEGSSGYASTADTMDRLGQAAEINARKIDTLQGSMAKLRSSLNVLQVQGGQDIIPMLKGMADAGTGLLNVFSSINNASPLIPQMALAVGAILGERKLGSVISDRRSAARDKAAAPGIRAAAQSAAEETQYREAIAQAEFTADSKIASAHRAMVDELMRLDSERYAKWVSLEEKTTEALNASDAKQLASLQAITSKTLSSIAEIDAAQAASSKANLDRQALDFAKQSDLLAVRQRGAMSSLAVKETAGGFAPNVQQQRQFAVEKATLEEEQAVVASYTASYQEIENRKFATRRDAEIAGGESLIATQERVSQEIKAGIIRNAESEALAQTEAAAITTRAAAERFAKERAAAEAGYLNVAGMGGASLVGSGVNDIEGSASRAMSSNAKVAQNVTVTAGAVTAERGLASKIGSGAKGLVTGAVAGIGKIALPVLIAISVKDMVIDPIENAWIQKIVDSDPKIKNLHARVNLTLELANTGKYPVANIEQVKKDAEEQRAEYQKQLDEFNKNLDNLHKTPVYGGFERAMASIDDSEGKARQTIQGKIDKINADIALLDNSTKSGPSSAEAKKQAFNEAKAELSQEIADIVSLYDNGAITMAEAKKKADAAAYALLSPNDPNAPSDIRQSNLDAQKTLEEHQRAVMAQARADAQTYADNIDLASKAKAAGASDTDILAGIFGKDVNGGDALGPQIQQAKKHIAELEQDATTAATNVQTAWQEAGAAVGKISPEKGIQSLIDAADGMKAAGDELSRLGLSNQAFSELDAISQGFKGIADAEQKASDAFNGYLAEFNYTDAAMGKLDALQKRLAAAEKSALEAKNAGRATPQDQWILDHYDQLSGRIRAERGSLSESEISSLIGQLQNVPDWSAINDAAIKKVNDLGGPEAFQRTLELDTKTAEQQIKTLLDDKKMKVTLVPTWEYPLNPSGPGFGSDMSNIAQGQNPIPYGGGTSTANNPDLSGFQNSPGTTSGGSFPPGGGNAPPGSWNAFHPLDESSYDQIVNKDSGASKDALLAHDTYASVIKAAQKYGVDPRVLLALVNNEQVAPDLLATNNFGGIKFDNQPGATPGAAIPQSEGGGQYAAFASPADYFMEMARNMTIGPYANSYQSGDLLQERRTYITGGAPGSPDQEQNAANTISTYNRYRTQYPSSPPAGGAYGFGSGGYASGAVNSVGQEIVQKALQSINTDHLAGYCEQFVEETVQAITGQRGATGRREMTASSAFTQAASMGLETKTPQPGDLVYYPDAAGGTGHVAIYMGGNKQVSTADIGGNLVHVEDIGKGARFITVGGSGNGKPLSEHQQAGAYSNIAPTGYGQGAVVTGAEGGAANNPYAFGTQDYNKGPTLPFPIPHTTDVSPEIRAITTYLAKMSDVGVNRVVSDQSRNAGYFNAVYTHGLEPGTGSYQNAQDEARKANLRFGAAEAKALFDAQDPAKADKMAADYQSMRDNGGEIAGNAVKWVQAQVKINQATRENIILQSELKDEADKAFQRNRDRQDADILLAAANLKRDRGIQDDNLRAASGFRTRQLNIQTETNTENVAYTSTSRKSQDDQRNLQFFQQVQATELQNKLADTQKAQNENIWQRTAQEQVVAGWAKNANTNQDAGKMSALLAGMHEQDLKQRDLNTKAIDDIQLQIREEARKANLDSFNLATRVLAEQRAHEDRMKQIADESQRLSNDQQKRSLQEQALSLKNQRDDQDAAIKRQAIRLQEDRETENINRAKQKQIELNNQVIAGSQKDQQVLDTLMSAATNGMSEYWMTAISLADAAKLSNGQPASSPFLPGSTTAIRRLGSYASGGLIPGFEGLSLVGDGPGGKILPTSEIISAPGATVTPMAMLRALGIGGQSTTIAVNAPITIGNLSQITDIEGAINAALAPVKEQLRAAITANKDQSRAFGRRMG